MKRILILLLAIFAISCSNKEDQNNLGSKNEKLNPNAKITFVELGSVNCIPCKKMQPIMKSIEKKYGSQINVVFHDVWQPEGKKYAQQYKISLIPTQVFLDKEGNEIFRHEGFFPEDKIDEFLQKQGLTPES